jgi:hypothetical protein
MFVFSGVQQTSFVAATSYWKRSPEETQPMAELVSTKSTYYFP